MEDEVGRGAHQAVDEDVRLPVVKRRETLNGRFVPERGLHPATLLAPCALVRQQGGVGAYIQAPREHSVATLPGSGPEREGAYISHIMTSRERLEYLLPRLSSRSRAIFCELMIRTGRVRNLAYNRSPVASPARRPSVQRAISWRTVTEHTVLLRPLRKCVLFKLPGKLVHVAYEWEALRTWRQPELATSVGRCATNQEIYDGACQGDEEQAGREVLQGGHGVPVDGGRSCEVVPRRWPSM